MRYIVLLSPISIGTIMVSIPGLFLGYGQNHEPFQTKALYFIKISPSVEVPVHALKVHPKRLVGIFDPVTVTIVKIGVT